MRAQCEIELERQRGELQWQWAGFLLHTAKFRANLCLEYQAAGSPGGQQWGSGRAAAA